MPVIVSQNGRELYCTQISMWDVQVHLCETVDDIRFERVKYRKSQVWTPYIYNFKLALFC